MKRVLLTSVCAAALFAGPASAQDMGIGSNLYISLFGGGSFLEDIDTSYNGALPYSVEYGTGFVVGLAVGANIVQNVRGELEFSFASNAGQQETAFGAGPVVSGGTDTYYVLANLWYDIPIEGPIKPYIGGGVGIGWHDSDARFGPPFGYGGTDSGFAYQLGGGVAIPLTNSVALDIGYRFKSLADVDFPDADGGGIYLNGDVNSHNVLGGLKVKLGG